MTLKKTKTKGLRVIKSVIQVILVFLFAVISTAILITIKKKNLMFEERIFYLVSVASEGRETLLEPQKELLKNLGAANMVYKKNDSYHLIASVYLEQEYAEEIKGNLTSYFPDVKILKIKSKRIGKKSIKKIRDVVGLEKLIKTLYAYTQDFQQLHMNFLAGKSSEGQFLNDMVRRKLELEKLNQQIELKNEYAEKAQGFGEFFALKMTNFLSGLDVSRSRQNYICNYFVGFYLDFIEFYNSL